MQAELPPPVAEISAVSSQDALAAAQAARLGGHWREAQAILESLVREEPRNADAWLQLGYAYAAEPDPAAARAAFERALDLAPDYDDAKIGLAHLAYRDGDLATARLWLGRIGSERWNDPEVAELRARLSQSAQSTSDRRFGLSVAHSALGAGLPDWREAEAWISERNGRQSIGASLQTSERFARTDVYGELRYAAAGDAAAVSVAAGAAPGADFRPRAALRVEISSLEDAEWFFSGAVTLARYSVGEVDKLDMRIGHAVGPLRLTALGVAVRDENGDARTGYGAGAMWRLADRFSLSAGWSDAPETSEGVTVDVRAATVSISGRTSGNARLTLSYTHEDRNAYDRDELSLGIARAF